MANARVPLEQPWADRWLRLIDARLGERRTRVDERRREVIRVLSGRHDGRATFEEIATLTPELTRTYAQKSPKAIGDDLRALMMCGLIEVPEPGVVRTRAFKMFDPKPPPRPSPGEAELLTRVLTDRAPQLLGVVDRLREGTATTPDEQFEVSEALMVEVSDLESGERGLTPRGDATFDLMRLFETRE
jgi:hypothetical protein